MAGKTSFEKANARRYLLEAGITSALYVLATFVVAMVAKGIEEGDPMRVAVALVPVIPALGMMIAVVRWVVRSDELEQLVQLKGAMLGAVAMIMFCITYGFLQAIADFPAFDLLWVAILGVLAWSISAALLKGQYK